MPDQSSLSYACKDIIQLTIVRFIFHVRRVEKPTTVQTQQQDPTRGVITQYECMCGGLRGPVGLPSPPPTSESDVQNYDSASCGGKISIGVADIRAGFMRGMKVTVCARHP